MTGDAAADGSVRTVGWAPTPSDDGIGEAALREHVDSTWRRLLTQRNDAATLALFDDLTGAGFTPLVLKGPATRASLGGTDQRPSSDIDLLVGPAELRQVQRHLRSLGYRRRPGVHADAWQRPGAQDVDLHWTLPRVGVSAASAWRLLTEHRVSLACAGGRVDVLSAPARLLHLALHATMDDSGRPQDDLRIALERASDADLSGAVDLAGALSCTNALSWALARVGRVDAAAHVGPVPQSLGTARGEGAWARATSGIHWREKWRWQWRLGEKWARWEAGRLGRLLSGRARTNERIAELLRGPRP